MNRWLAYFPISISLALIVIVGQTLLFLGDILFDILDWEYSLSVLFFSLAVSLPFILVVSIPIEFFQNRRNQNQGVTKKRGRDLDSI